MGVCTTPPTLQGCEGAAGCSVGGSGTKVEALHTVCGSSRHHLRMKGHESQCQGLRVT